MDDTSLSPDNQYKTPLCHYQEISTHLMLFISLSLPHRLKRIQGGWRGSRSAGVHSTGQMKKCWRKPIMPKTGRTSNGILKVIIPCGKEQERDTKATQTL